MNVVATKFIPVIRCPGHESDTIEVVIDTSGALHITKPRTTTPSSSSSYDNRKDFRRSRERWNDAASTL